MKLMNYEKFVKRHPLLETEKGFSTSQAKMVGVTKTELKKIKGFVCLGLVREVDRSGGEPKLVTSQWWVYDPKLWDLRRKAHRNGAEYRAQYVDYVKKYGGEQDGQTTGQ